jgi:hypothetical protein
MWKFFQRKGKQMRGKRTKVPMNPLEYPPKIILAWAKAIEGHDEIRDWLAKNGYEELAVACWAIRLNTDSRDWLMENGFPHLMAMINAAEGNEQARIWLEKHGFTMLYNLGLAGDGEQEGFAWIQKNCTPDIFILAQTIRKIKDEIEERHNDVHSFGE